MKKKARKNPLGLPLDGTTPGKAGRPPFRPVPAGSCQVVVTKEGLLTHILNPATGGLLCASGTGRAGGKQQLFVSDARNITCYRCGKLASMNRAAGRKAWAAA